MLIPFLRDRCMPVSFAYRPSFWSIRAVCSQEVCLPLTFIYFFVIVLVRVWWSHSSHNRCWSNDICELFCFTEQASATFICVWRIEVYAFPLFFVEGEKKMGASIFYVRTFVSVGSEKQDANLECWLRFFFFFFTFSVFGKISRL